MADLEDKTVQDLTRAINENILALKKTNKEDLVQQKYYKKVISDNISVLRELQKAQATLIEEGKGNAKAYESITKKLVAAELELDLYNAEIEKAIALEKKRQKAVQEGIKTLAGLGDAQTKGTEKIAYFTKAFEDMPFLSGLSKLAGSLDYNIDSYRQLAAGGADFGKSLIGMREAARTAQLGLEDFKKLITNNQPTLAGLYGTVNKGVDGLARMSEILRRPNSGLYELGVTTEDLLKYQGTYLERQMMQGRRDFLNNELAAKQTTAYVKELNVLSRLTGVQNEELDKQVKRQQQDGVFQAYLSSLGEEESRKTQTLIGALSAVNPALGETAKNLLATGVPLDDLGQELTALAPGFQDAILAFKQTGDLTGTMVALRDSGKEFNERFKGTSGAATLLAGGLSNASNAVLTLGNLSMDTATAQEELRKKADPLTKQLAEFENATKRLKSAFESIQTSFLNTLGPTLSKLVGGTTDGFTKVANSIQEFTTKFPATAAALYTTAMIGVASANYARDVSVVATGTMIANGKLGFGQLLSTIGNLTKGLGRWLPAIAATIEVGQGIMEANSDDPTTSKRGKARLGGAAAGAAAGAAIGSVIPGIGTAVGALIGAGLGGYAGGSAMDSRALGGDLTTGRPTLVGERGPELILPKSSGTVAPLMMSKTSAGAEITPVTGADAKMGQINSLVNTLNSTLGSVNETMDKTEKHLNKLVRIAELQLDKTSEVKNSIAQLDYAIVK